MNGFSCICIECCYKYSTPKDVDDSYDDNVVKLSYIIIVPFRPFTLVVVEKIKIFFVLNIKIFTCQPMFIHTNKVESQIIKCQSLCLMYNVATPL